MGALAPTGSGLHDAVRPEPLRFLLMTPSGDRGKAVAWTNCMKVAGWLRHAAAERLRPEVDSSLIRAYVQGHTTEEEKAQRLSYVPVPSIGGRYGDGLIRRACIVEPAESTGKLSRLLRLKLTGRVLADADGREACSLAPAPDDDWIFERYIPRRESYVWRSVTPVVLHGFNAARHATASAAKTERLLLRAFEMAGYGQLVIEKLVFQGAPWFAGSKPASAMRVPKHLEGYPRVHVEVRFRHGVRGPVLAGIGRHFGIGLFATAGGE
jgi:CRISPR-associated protein Csb2